MLLLEGQCSFWLAGTCRVSTAELSQLKPLLSFRGPHRSQFGCAQLLQFGYPLIFVVSAMAKYIFFEMCGHACLSPFDPGGEFPTSRGSFLLKNLARKFKQTTASDMDDNQIVD